MGGSAWTKLLAAAAAGMVWFAAAPAQAQQSDEQDLSAESCAFAYWTAAELRGRLMSAAANGTAPPSLGGLTDNWLATHVWQERAQEVGRDLPGGGIFTPEAAQIRGGELYVESASTGLDHMLAPERIFAGQRALFATVRACDLAHGFEPALSVPPPPETIIALLDAQQERRDAQLNARLDQLANMDDRQCAARFFVIGSLMARDPAFQQVMATRMDIAARKAREAEPGLDMQRFTEQVRREAQERASKVTGQEDLDPLLEEVNACEHKYGEPLTTRNPS